MASLAEIRALLKAESEKADAIKNGTFTGNSEPDAFLAFWNIPEGQPLYLRFLEDADTSNPYFWKERDMINLTFNGIKGVHNDLVKIAVPCNEMWGPKDSCPVTKELREWYKTAKETNNEELEKLASKYWKKKTYLFQCLIAPDSTAVKDDNAPENPIRRVLMNKQLFTKIRSILMNPGVKELPTHPTAGRDFGVIKAKNGGGFAVYDESQFSMSERPLNETELAAIEKYGTFNLNDFMPKQPTPEELNAIKEMFEASVNGEAYDPQRWSAFYRPAGISKPASAEAALSSQPATQQTVTTKPVQTEQKVEPVQETPVQVQETVKEPTATASKTDAASLLSRLKARQA